MQNVKKNNLSNSDSKHISYLQHITRVMPFFHLHQWIYTGFFNAVTPTTKHLLTPFPLPEGKITRLRCLSEALSCMLLISGCIHECVQRRRTVKLFYPIQVSWLLNWKLAGSVGDPDIFIARKFFWLQNTTEQLSQG